MNRVLWLFVLIAIGIIWQMIENAHPLVSVIPAAWYWIILILGFLGYEGWRRVKPFYQNSPQTSYFVRETRGAFAPNRKLLIFVHGLLGDGKSTWTSENGSYWPKLVAEDPLLKDFDILVIFLPQFLKEETLNLTEWREALNQELESQRVFEPKPYQALYFVAHSVGSLVVRGAVRQEKLYHQVRPALLLALGSPATEAELAQLKGSKRSAFVSEPWFQEIKENWRDRLPPGMEIACAYGVRDEIVSKNSAIYAMTRSPAEPIAADHRTLSQPRQKEAQIHLWLRSQLIQKPDRVLYLEQWKENFRKTLVFHPQLSAEERQQMLEPLAEAATALELNKVGSAQPRRFEEALLELERGMTHTAEVIFHDLFQQRRASALQAQNLEKHQEAQRIQAEASEMARHLGALALLQDLWRAMKYYRQAIELDPEHPSGWYQLGRLLLRTGALAEAENAFRHMLHWAENHQAIRWQAQAESLLARVHEVRGDWLHAETSYQQALKAFETLGDQEGTALISLSLGCFYQKRENWKQAEERLQYALQLFQTLNFSAESAKAWDHLGQIAAQQKNWSQAQIRYDEALKIQETLGSPEELAAIYERLGALYHQREAWAEAENSHLKALKIHESLGHKSAIALSFQHLGRLHQQKQNFPQAHLMYQKALGLFEELGMQDEIETLQNNLQALKIIWETPGTP